MAFALFTVPDFADLFQLISLFAVGMVKQPTSEQSEFTMSNEDFPALPGTQNSDGTTNAIGNSSGSGSGVVGGAGGGNGGGGSGSGGITENNLDGTEKPMNSIVVSGGGLGGGGSTGTTSSGAVVGGNGHGAVGSGLGGVVGSGGGASGTGGSGVSASHVGLVGTSGSGGGAGSGSGTGLNTGVTGNNAMMGVGGGLGSGSGSGTGSGDHMNDNSSNDKLVKSGVQTSPDGEYEMHEKPQRLHLMLFNPTLDCRQGHKHTSEHGE